MRDSSVREQWQVGDAPAAHVLTGRRIGSALLLVALVALTGARVPFHAAALQTNSFAQSLQSPSCTFPFHAAVSQGTDAGFSLSGQFQLPLTPDGAYAGVLVEDDGTQIPVVGQVIGRSMTVLFDLGQGRLLSGLGTADSAIEDCGFLQLLGPFVGPSLDDGGAWGEPCGGFLEPSCKPPSHGF